MRFIITTFLFFIVVFCNAQIWMSQPNLDTTQDSILKIKPEFYTLQWKQGAILLKNEIGITIDADSISNHFVKVLVNENKNPVLYASKISTPVCADGECKFMNIELYWTLLGDYAGFNRYMELPLTKHDHDEFLDEDYLKLHQLLTDSNSILKRRTIDELVEKPKPDITNGLDALSGATIAEVKESVVSGALYSCYTAWHLAHGNIKSKLKAYTKAVITEDILIDMLYSNNSNYQLFAINNLNKEHYKKHCGVIAVVFKTSTPLVRGVIVKGLAKVFLESPDLQLPFWDAFTSIDINSKSLLLKYLDSAPKSVIEGLSLNLDVMTKNQLSLFLNHLSNQYLSPEIIKNLTIFASSDMYSYAYLVEQFLKE